ncbi:MAG: 6-pyruvoyl-tetrahydropterin synthase-related protein [Ardenticatenales bacterium]
MIERRPDRLRAAARALAVYAPAALVVIAAVAALYPALAAAGIVATRAGGDSPFLLQRTHQMAVALRSGQFPPRWMPDAAYGLGYPFWNYYAPLAYLFAGAIAALGGGVIGAVKLTQAAAFVLAALGAYRLARRTWGTAPAGVVAAAAYTFAPYHLLNVYVRGDALAELAAYAIAPWLLVAVDGVLVRPSARAVARLAVVAAALVLAHNISALLFAPVAAAYTLWRWWRRRALVDAHRIGGDDGAPAFAAPRASNTPPSPAAGWMAGAVARANDWLLDAERRGWRVWRAVRSPAGGVALAALLGAALAAWFWAPAILEQGAVQLSGNTSGYFDYRNHFLSIIDLSRLIGERGDTSGALGLLRSLVAGPAVLQLRPFVSFDAANGVPATTGLLLALLAIAGAVGVWRRPGARGAVRFWAAVAIGATLLTTAVSWPLWALIRPMAWAQFPWRWLNVQALALAMLAGGVGALPAPRVRLRWAAALGALVLLGATGLADLHLEVLSIDQPTHADLEAFELFSGNIGTTVRSEYLPWAVNPRPVASVHSVAGVRVGPRATSGVAIGSALVHRGSTGQTWQVDVGGAQPVTLAVPMFWFPGAQATIDDDPPLPTHAIDGSGWLAVDVPPGRHLVAIALGRTPVRSAAEVVSLAALMIVAALWLSSRSRLRLDRRALFAVLLLGAAVFAARALPVGSHSGPVTFDWPRMPYPHANPGGVPFGASRLIAARFEGQDDLGIPLDAGGAVSLAMDWTTPAPGSTLSLALVSPAEPQLGMPEDWSVTREPVTTTVTASLPLPRELPDGVWFVRLTVADAAGTLVPARNAAGHSMGAVYLGPIRTRHADRPAISPPSGVVLDSEAVALDEVRWSQAADVLAVRLTWQTRRALTADLKTSVRLLRHGQPVTGPNGPVQDDKVPGYGFNPPTAWPIGQAVEDRRWLTLPPGLPAGEDYALQVVLYDAWTQAELGSGTVDGVVIATVPSAEVPSSEASPAEAPPADATPADPTAAATRAAPTPNRSPSP